MNALLQWIEDRTGLWATWRRCADRPVPGGACSCRVWPCTILFLFCVQAITGFCLWVYYSPSAQTAWESLHYLHAQVPGGWLLRAIHHYSAQVLIALTIIYVLQMILTRAYRAPRELVFWMAVGMGLCALAAVLTGDLLGWSQNGYAATQQRTGFLTLLPGALGKGLWQLAIGGPGPALGHHTLTRFFALHVGAFGAGFLVLLILHAVFARRAEALQIKAGKPFAMYWPDQAWRSAVACLLLMLVVLLLACRHGLDGPQAGAPLGSPADPDPAHLYTDARPEWFLLGVYEFSHWFGSWGILPIFVFPGLVLCLVLAMPWIGRSGKGHGFNVVFTVALVIFLAVLSWRSAAKDAADPKHQRGIAAEEQMAQWAWQFAAAEHIPPTGALTLLRKPKLFVKECATCHSDSPGAPAGIVAETPTAPNLHRFATRQWLEGLLDPEQFVGPEYFGNTVFNDPKNTMLDHLRQLRKDYTDDNALDELKEELGKAAAAVSAEAQLPSQQEADEADKDRIAAGRKLIAGGLGCTDCHKFHKTGTLGTAPELTGYGSKPWIIGIVGNPADRRFYGKKNDRMPAYQEVLSPREIELLAEWLRGDPSAP